jgi:hypothetical protein
MEMAVKSWREPKMASLINASQVVARDWVGVCAIVLKRPLRQRRLIRLQKKREKAHHRAEERGDKIEEWLLGEDHHRDSDFVP